ncbi:MAG: hypothetical protein LBB80_04985 [Treponema sp.]|jgi:hypothetical protein|nr:hypothetical protein [Treponema sp.]
MALWSTVPWLKIRSTMQTFRVNLEDALQTRRNLVLLLGGLVFFLICLIGVLILRNHRANIPSNFSRTLSNDFKPLSIAPEDIFLPDEPDFLPEVLLNREPRNPWTVEDVRPFWTDPLQDDPELWRERIKVTIDTFLEGVP